MRSTTHATPHDERGFSLMEVMVAMLILTVGLMGLAQVFYGGMAIMMSSPSTLIAREKAREAIESVHAARDTVILNWAQIRNVESPDGPPDGCPAGTTPGDGGVFLTGPQPLRKAGVDGLVNTSDDIDVEASPGPDNQIGTSDDVALTGFTRQIDICDVNGNTALRMIIVTIGYRAAGGVGAPQRTVVLRTLISSFS